jgi:hypothetical protein
MSLKEYRTKTKAWLVKQLIEQDGENILLRTKVDKLLELIAEDATLGKSLILELEQCKSSHISVCKQRNAALAKLEAARDDEKKLGYAFLIACAEVASLRNEVEDFSDTEKLTSTDIVQEILNPTEEGGEGSNSVPSKEIPCRVELTDDPKTPRILVPEESKK